MRWNGSHRHDIGERAFQIIPSFTTPRYSPTFRTTMYADITFEEMRDDVEVTSIPSDSVANETVATDPTYQRQAHPDTCG